MSIILGTCYGFTEDYREFAMKTVSDAFLKISNEDSNKASTMNACIYIKNKLKEKYGGRWGVTIFKEKNDLGNASFDAENYMKLFYKGYEIIILSLDRIDYGDDSHASK